MGRKKIPFSKKAVGFCTSFPKNVFEEMEIKRGTLDRGKFISKDLQWQWGLLSSVGLAMDDRFTVNEVSAILKVHTKIQVEAGQVAFLKRQFGLLFLAQEQDTKGLQGQKQLKALENKFEISTFALRKKLTSLSELEALWLHLACERAGEMTGEDEEQIKFMFRCG
jgi:hypothetical protein